MTIEAPTQSPLELLKLLREESSESLVTEDGFEAYLDGPMMCPVEVMFPVASRKVNDRYVCFYPDAAEDEAITEETAWTKGYTL